jgi:tRNA pseudouridine38-40 synthase
VGAGRTDAGVHARGQAFHFDLHHGEQLHDNNMRQLLQTSLNSMLPRDVRVWNLQEAPPPVTKEEASNDATTTTTTTITTFPWHVIYNCNQKLYSYRICTAASMDPLERHNRHYVDWGDMHVLTLEWALQQFQGTHDFRAFSGAMEQKEKREGRQLGTVRTVYKVDLVDEGHGRYRIDFLLQGALYKMVRNMVGTALDVSRGRLEKDTFLGLLHHNTSNEVDQFGRDDNPCKPAPPEGLTLERVFYDGDF